MAHQVTLGMLTSYIKDEVLAGSTEDVGGKQIVMYVEFDELGHLVAHFHVITGTNDPNNHNTVLVTQQLSEAISKYNSL